MKFYRSLIAFAIPLIILSCQKTIDVNLNTSVAAKTMIDVAYGTDALQKMDVYLPANRSTAATKVIVLIHGGGWNSLDKSDRTEYVDSLRIRMPDYAIFNINYRLASGTTNLFPAQENDVNSAVQFIVGKENEYLISQKFVLVGESAGGHLSLLQAYKHSSTIKPKAVVDFFGPTDLADMYNNPANPLVPPAIAAVVGATPSQNPTLYASSSPINFVTATSPPTIILHGGADVLVRYQQSVALKAKLDSLGVINQYVFYPTENHGWYGATLTDSFNKIQAFLMANVN